MMMFEDMKLLIEEVTLKAPDLAALMRERAGDARRRLNRLTEERYIRHLDEPVGALAMLIEDLEEFAGMVERLGKTCPWLA